MRTITTEFSITKLRGYSWRVSLAYGEDGKIHGQITETYVCTDDNYTAVPEGQKNFPVELNPELQGLLDNLLGQIIQAAADREEVDPEMIPEQVEVSPEAVTNAIASPVKISRIEVIR